MSYRVDILKTVKGNLFASLNFSGAIDSDALVSSFTEVAKLPQFDPSMNSCWDFTDATLEVDYAEIKQVAEHFVESAGNRTGSPYCAFVSSAADDIALLETYIPAAARYPAVFQIHHNRQQALSWLDSHHTESTV